MEDRFRFRAWNKIKQSYDYDIQECQKIPLHNSNKEKCFACFQSYLDNQDILEIEQCTGLKDKNGKLIYEGDIVKAVYSDGTESGFELPICRHRQCFNVGLNGSDAGWLDEDFIGEVEIIGNIHENPLEEE